MFRTGYAVLENSSKPLNREPSVGNPLLRSSKTVHDRCSMYFKKKYFWMRTFISRNFSVRMYVVFEVCIPTCELWQLISDTQAFGCLEWPTGEDTDIRVGPQADDRKFQTNILFQHIPTHDNKQAKTEHPIKCLIPAHAYEQNHNVHCVGTWPEFHDTDKTGETWTLCFENLFFRCPQQCTTETPCSETHK